MLKINCYNNYRCLMRKTQSQTTKRVTLRTQWKSIQYRPSGQTKAYKPYCQVYDLHFSWVILLKNKTKLWVWNIVSHKFPRSRLYTCVCYRIKNVLAEFLSVNPPRYLHNRIAIVIESVVLSNRVIRVLKLYILLFWAFRDALE